MFKTIGLFGKYQDNSIEKPFKKLTKHLERKGVVVKVGHTTADEIARQLPFEQLVQDICRDIDLAIVIGGDGTLLHVARHTAEANVPVAGINLGRLGFLTDIALDEMLDEIDLILNGQFEIEQRLMLQVDVIKDQQTVFQQLALNDVVIGKHALEKLIAWRVQVNDQFVTAARSDGVIISTPTGSTAYALSAGGPILHPGLDVLIMVPVSPHTLTNRPIALPADSVIEFSVTNKAKNVAHVFADGLIGTGLEGDETIRITRSKHTVKLVHTETYNYFAMLRAKLGWGGV